MSKPDLAKAHLRVARSTDNLDAVVRFYREGPHRRRSGRLSGGSAKRGMERVNYSMEGSCASISVRA